MGGVYGSSASKRRIAIALFQPQIPQITQIFLLRVNVVQLSNKNLCNLRDLWIDPSRNTQLNTDKSSNDN